MLYYNKINVSEGIDVNKWNKSKECMICHYWYILGLKYTYEQYVCNGGHDISMMTYELKKYWKFKWKICWLQMCYMKHD